MCHLFYFTPFRSLEVDLALLVTQDHRTAEKCEEIVAPSLDIAGHDWVFWLRSPGSPSEYAYSG